MRVYEICFIALIQFFAKEFKAKRISVIGLEQITVNPVLLVIRRSAFGVHRH